MNVKGTRNSFFFGTGVEKNFVGFLEAVGPLHIHTKVLTTFIMIFWHNSST